MKILALDGGTHDTGWAVFADVKLTDSGLLTAPKKAWTHERIGVILDLLQDLILTHEPDILVCEGSFSRWTPELGLLIKSFRKLARLNQIEYVAYNASTVIRVVSGKKVPRLRKNRKSLLAQCVAEYYPKHAEQKQDTLDAICIGRTHLIRTGSL